MIGATTMQTVTQARLQAKKVVRKLGARDLDNLPAGEQERLLNARALLRRRQKIAGEELRLRIRRGRL